MNFDFLQIRRLWASHQRDFAWGLRWWGNECNRLFLQSWQRWFRTRSNRSQWKILAVPFSQTILTEQHTFIWHMHTVSFLFWHIDGKNILFLLAHPHVCVRVCVCVYLFKLNSFQSANKLQRWFHWIMFLNKLNWIKLNREIKIFLKKEQSYNSRTSYLTQWHLARLLYRIALFMFYSGILGVPSFIVNVRSFIHSHRSIRISNMADGFNPTMLLLIRSMDVVKILFQ